MLSYLVLAALQIVAAWYGEPHVTKYLPSTFGPLVNDVFEAVVYAVIVWIVGFAASFVLKIREPGSATLVTSLVFALIGVAIVVLLPTYGAAYGLKLPAGVNKEFIPLAGAVIGYLLRR